MDNVLQLSKAETADLGLPRIESIQLAKALRILCRKLDQSPDITFLGLEALIDAVTVSSIPETLVP